MVEHFLAAVVDEADYQKRYTAIASELFVAISQRVSVRSGVLFYIVMDVSLMRRLFVLLVLCSQADGKIPF